MKKGKSSINRRDFLNLSMYAGIGLIYSQLSKYLPTYSLNDELNITAEELRIIRDFPHPFDPTLTRIIDDSNVITEDEINDLIEPRLVNLVDYNEHVTPYGFPLLNEEIQAHELCIFDLAEMLDASYKENLTLYIASGYRDYYAQEMALIKANGNEVLVTLPGYSQHHSGLAFDFTSAGINKVVGWLSGFENTPEGIWLYKNAYRYGFVQSFTQFHDDRLNESWHYIYVGRPIARYYVRLKVKGWDGDIFDLMALHNRHFS